MSAATPIGLRACRHLRQAHGACTDCGHVWGETRAELQARHGEASERIFLLVALLREQDADAQRLWAGCRSLVLRMAALMMIDRVARRCLQRVMDQLVAFDERCKAGDVDGATLALRAWIHKHGS